MPPSSQGARTLSNSARSASNRNGQSGSYGVMTTCPRSSSTVGEYRASDTFNGPGASRGILLQMDRWNRLQAGHKQLDLDMCLLSLGAWGAVSSSSSSLPMGLGILNRVPHGP